MTAIPILDETIIAEAKAMMKAKFPVMAQYYFEDSDGYIAAIRSGLNQQAVDKIISPAHTLKSSSRQMGALRLSDIAKQIEHLARDQANGNNAAAQFAELVNELEEVFSDTKRAYEAHRS